MRRFVPGTERLIRAARTGFEEYGTIDPVMPPVGWAELRPTFMGRDMRRLAQPAREQRAEILELLRAQWRRRRGGIGRDFRESVSEAGDMNA